MADRPLPGDVYAATVEAMAERLTRYGPFNTMQATAALDAALAGPLGDHLRALADALRGMLVCHAAETSSADTCGYSKQARAALAGIDNEPAEPA